MIKKLNKAQKEALADFFKSVAVAWFSAAFTVPFLTSVYDLLTLFRYLASMGVALYIALYILKENI